MKADTEFEETIQEIHALSGQLLSRVLQVRVQQWVTKLSIPTPIHAWKRNRNLHARLLLEMVSRGKLEAPFDKLPPCGELRTIPSHLLSSYMLSVSPRSADSSYKAKNTTIFRGHSIKAEKAVLSPSSQVSARTSPSPPSATRPVIRSNGLKEDLYLEDGPLPLKKFGLSPRAGYRPWLERDTVVTSALNEHSPDVGLHHHHDNNRTHMNNHHHYPLNEHSPDFGHSMNPNHSHGVEDDRDDSLFKGDYTNNLSRTAITKNRIGGQENDRSSLMMTTMDDEPPSSWKKDKNRTDDTEIAVAAAASSRRIQMLESALKDAESRADQFRRANFEFETNMSRRIQVAESARLEAETRMEQLKRSQTGIESNVNRRVQSAELARVEAETKMEQLRRMNVDLEARCKRLEKQVSEVKDELESSRTRTGVDRSRLDDVHRQRDQEIEDLKREMERLRGRYEVEIARLTREIDVARFHPPRQAPAPDGDKDFLAYLDRYSEYTARLVGGQVAEQTKILRDSTEEIQKLQVQAARLSAYEEVRYPSSSFGPDSPSPLKRLNMSAASSSSPGRQMPSWAASYATEYN
mmetsp:Transcript_23755/g.39751  ORF Transcript_23755/g.39751 Transcript_23755/m.39751 type:complete len:578 (+) Transcript_23755:137-1870(+)|eukprot:CAMPEP_0184337898 /NCGR_PEP_ID=MMETSP1089-20130417/6374_1 /TAXON_ID=38269 ORGANISM="Gloeochaete wittrockiana, Strain SAG46.84" /NCGR_SAMPLE_ID=MMETSP1089 /ASSEMBLY_ACC=CAM_ASM_000445 /LENGTH=577 /DNA_ID=CAMNT_0026664031 /DNA_START=70 /DNA_END=1803 /DNA_ORIENTATION=-